MDKEIITFDYIEFEKRKFQGYTDPFCLHDIDTSRIFLSNKSSCKKNYKYFILAQMRTLKLNHYI